KVVGLEWLRDERVRPAFVCPTPRFLFGVGGEHHYWKLAGRRLRADVVEDLPSVHSGEADVKDDQIGRFCRDGLKAAGPIFPGDDFDVSGSKANLDKPPDNSGILNYQDAVTHVSLPLGLVYGNYRPPAALS
ncbi:MAG TPA: hypothetical protein VIA81_12210, partial [Acidimicrobiia bacterium]